MASKTQIINMALIKIGEATISDNDMSDDKARTAHYVFDMVADEVLVEGPETGWRFARQRVAVDVSSESPDFGYDYKFQIPSDCVPSGIISVEVGGVSLTDWITEGDFILTNQEGTTIDLVYIKRIADTGKYPPHFIKVLYYSLAIQFALKRSAKDRLVDGLRDELEMKILPRAKAMDSRAIYVKEFNNDWQETGRSGANTLED